MNYKDIIINAVTIRELKRFVHNVVESNNKFENAISDIDKSMGDILNTPVVSTVPDKQKENCH